MEKLKSLFYEQSLRRWHFKDLIEESGLSRERVNYYLNQLKKEKFIQRIKVKAKMPYYSANIHSPAFRTGKRLYGLQILAESGLLAHLASCKGIKTAILFGSFARGDWNKSSDIDLFVYGDDNEFNQGFFEKKLGREIQVFSYDQPSKIKELDPSLIPNILKGISLTDSIEPFKIGIYG